MSDAILNDGPNHYYYIGNDKFLFGGGSAVTPLEDALTDETSPWSGSSQSLSHIEQVLTAFREQRVEGIVSKSQAVNRACRAILGGIEARIASQEQSLYYQGTELEGVTPVNDTAHNFPRGSKVNPETWGKLLLLAKNLLRRHGYLITQRDKKYLTEKSGVFVSPYIWSTLVDRMGLRRVRNPYSSSALVIYVPALSR